MPGRLQDKVAIITGAGTVGPGWGNGKAAAVLFAREGAKILAVDINEKAAEDTRDIIAKEGGTCRVHKADVTKDADVKGMIDACVAAFGRIDILHNNVGGSEPGGPVEMTEEVWDRQMNYNLKHVFLACKHALPVMERQGKGSIINVASVSGLSFTGHFHIAYDSAKAGLIKFTKALGVNYASKGIRCNCVIPGQMHTPLVDTRLAKQYRGGDFQGMLAERQKRIPMGHMGDAWDVAYAALFLASDEAKYVTAADIVVDGGLTSKCN